MGSRHNSEASGAPYRTGHTFTSIGYDTGPYRDQSYASSSSVYPSMNPMYPYMGAGGVPAFPNTPAAAKDASSLPENTPTSPSDPIDQAMLLDYLTMVRNLRGEEAAAAAAATAGYLPPSLAQQERSPDTKSLFSHLSGPPSSSSGPPSTTTTGSSSATAAADQQQLQEGSAGAADATTGRSSSGEHQVVSNILGFIKERKLAGTGPPKRLSSSSSASSVASSAAGGQPGSKRSTGPGGMKIWIQPSGEEAGVVYALLCRRVLAGIRCFGLACLHVS